jgi:hypothetical protein
MEEVMTDNPEVPEEETAPPAEAQPPEPPPSEDKAIPYARFSEVNKEKNALAKQVAAFEAAEETRKRAELEAQGKLQEIIADLEPQAKRAAELEKVVQANLDREMDSIPESFRGLIPEGDAATRLQWVLNAKAGGLFAAPKAPPTDAGVLGDSPKSAKLSADEADIATRMGITPAEYAAMKDNDYTLKDVK